MREKMLLAWSGGKDSALALEELLHTGTYQIIGLLTTVTEGYDRVSMHGIRKTLLEHQALSLGLPLDEVYIPQQCSNEDYQARMQEAMAQHIRSGLTVVAFGDLFLEEIRSYREDNLTHMGIKAVFPLWQRNTTELARFFIDRGYKAVVSCVDSTVLGPSFVGRHFDDTFLADLPAAVDPCGEHGEFHTFVWDGPLFSHPISLQRGEVALRENRFWFCDLVPGDT